MQELDTPSPDPPWYLDNAEILIADYARELDMKSLDQKAAFISRRLSQKMRNNARLHEVIDESVELIARELRPSCFGYVCSVVASEFPYTFSHWCQTGVLASQIRMLVKWCLPVLTEPRLSVSPKKQQQIFHALKASTRHYLETHHQLRLPGTCHEISADAGKELVILNRRKKKPEKRGRNEMNALDSPYRSFSDQNFLACCNESGGLAPELKARACHDSKASVSEMLLENVFNYSLTSVTAFWLTDLIEQAHRVNPALSFCLFACASVLIVKLVAEFET